MAVAEVEAQAQGNTVDVEHATREDLLGIAPIAQGRVAVLGFAESWQEAPFDDPNVTIIGLNELYKYVPRWDEWIEIHDEDSLGLTRRAVGQAEDEVEVHRKWLLMDHGTVAQRSTDTVQALEPDLHARRIIWMQDRFCDGQFPNAKPYPRKDIARKLAAFSKRPGEYITSSVAAGLALAITRGRDDQLRPVDSSATKWLGVYGIDLIGQGEYAYQRPCVEWLVGIAQGLRIDVSIPEASALLRSDHVYGYEVTQEGPVTKSLLLARRAKLKKDMDLATRNFYQFRGAHDECTNWLNVVEGKRRGIKELPVAFLDSTPQVDQNI